MKPVKVIERLRDVIAGEGPRPIARTLRVGQPAHELLSEAAGWRSVHAGRLLPSLYGVEVERVTELRYAWQLLNGEGEIITMGVVDP